MGRGNVCTLGKYEGLYYIDNDDYFTYSRQTQDGEWEYSTQRELDYDELTGGEWKFDWWETDFALDCIVSNFLELFTKMFPSFDQTEKKDWIWIDREKKVIAESKLFYIAMEDNGWSTAIELIQKEEPWGLGWMEGLQRTLYKVYLRAMQKCLLEILECIGCYKGPWTSGTIKRGEESDV